MAGRTLRYVATLDDRWVALLGWQAAAYQCQAREALTICIANADAQQQMPQSDPALLQPSDC